MSFGQNDKSGLNSSGLDLKSLPSCSFESFCEHLSQNASQIFLTQNPDGERLLNFDFAKTLNPMDSSEKASLIFLNPMYFQDQDFAGGVEQLASNRSLLKLASARVEGLFEKVRSKTIQYLQSQANKDNKGEIENFIERVRTVKFVDPYKEHLKDFSLSLQGCDKPNAYYTPYAHSIFFCTQTLNLPRASLYMLIAHELAHTLDPCNASRLFTKTGEHSYMTLGTRESIRSKNNHSSIHKMAVPQTKYPFNQTLSCMKLRDSAEVPEISVDDIVEATKNSYAGATPITGFTIEAILEIEGESFENRKKALQKYYPQYRYCADFTSFSFMAESFADWFAAEIIAEELKNIEDTSKNTDKAAAFAFEALGFLWQRCPHITQKMSFTPPEGRQSVEDYNNQFRDRVHLSAERRVDRIFLAQPQIWRSLDCKNQKQARSCP